MKMAKFVLTINSQEIVVSFGDAVVLYKELHELFGKRQQQFRQRIFELSVNFRTFIIS
jgi:hypothetical protein